MSSSSRVPRKRRNEETSSPVPAKRTRSGQNKTRSDKGAAVAVTRTRNGKKGESTSASPATTPGSSKAGAAYPRKPTLFDDLDSPLSAKSGSNRQHLMGLDDDDDDDSDNSDASSTSSLSVMSDTYFEDVPFAKAETGTGKAAEKRAKEKQKDEEDDDDDDDDDEDIEFEDVAAPAAEPAPFSLLSMAKLGDEDGAGPSGDLELTLHKDERVSLTNPFGAKKGPSKMERLVRSATHCMHVQALLWHNALRNAWLCDPEVQGLLLSHLPPRLWDEVDRWRRHSGLEKPPPPPPTKNKKGKGKDRAAREWSGAAARLEEGAVDMSHGDPLFRLLRALSAWWRQKFRVTAPGLRKTGYLSLERLDRFLKAAKDTAGKDPARFGEHIRNRAAFRLHAQTLTGSRDVGAQLFTALLRALGLEARMVASLQPLGFGWSKQEDADPEADGEEGNDTKEAGDATPIKAQPSSSTQFKSTTPQRATKSRRTSRASTLVAIKDESEEEGLELAEVNSDNDSLVVVPEEKTAKPPAAAYDKDLPFPHYWTEVLSPVTHKYVPVDALVKRVVATNRELIESFEPRGAQADRVRQVVAYIVGYSADGTAKDVTVRYLRRQMLPGRTKGFRFPVEKVPVYDKRGKVKHYDQFDWFRQAVLRGYARGNSDKHPLTEVDENEDSTDLKPAKPEKKVVQEGEETLQFYKQSKEFVLERHLKREEALVADAVPVKVFRNGKKRRKRGAEDNDDDPGGEAENVYLRKDVVAVKSAETWHKQGRAPVAGQQPLKRVPYRAATLNRKREIAEAEAATGGKVLQGLYSFEQTDWIIPPPIQNGVIPKNEYGNIDLFVSHMLPRGARHVPYRGAARVCRRLQVDFAEAVVDFEFGHRMAVPVIQGVVVAEEHHDRVMAELARDEAERARKEDEKRRNAALSLWRKMLMGLRIVERIRQDYGALPEDERVFGSGHHVIDLDADEGGQQQPAHATENVGGEDMAGGFLPEGYEYEEEPKGSASHGQTISSFFPVHDEDEDDGESGFVIEDSRVS